MRRPLLAVLLTLGLCVGLAVPGASAGVRRGLLPFGCASGARIHCFGQVVLGAGSLAPQATSGPVGYGPKQLQSAYRVAGKHASGRIVAIVDAYDDPKAESDLAVYRKTYGLPPCTTANHCFRKVNQDGRSAPLPKKDFGWAEEISLDLDAVSATCPDCRILLVEASAPESGPLMAAVDSAVRLGAVAVSNSYGGGEDASILSYDAHLNHPGVAITASSGDNGYGVQWPASSRYVTAVGGTTLKRSSTTRGWTETAWSGSGSGCSKYEPKPSWQHDTGCKRRTVADVAAVADPATGLGVYDTYNSCFLASICDGLISGGLAQGLNGWAQIGGTSLSAPIVASIYALAGNRRGASYAYSHTASLFDVRSGTNGTCSVAYLCTARTGYDGPTGLGTPNGLGAF